ncbi:MAG: DUF2147 domain-containing protein [Saprospiraceae bacterium]|nr:DUF2147 domain-containing protein [Saprospiraceae bacterium]
MENLSSFDLFRHIVLTDFLRYFITAASAYLIFWVIFKKRWRHRIIQQRQFRNGQLLCEFGYSMSTVAIFAGIGFGIVSLKRAGFTLIYNDFGDRGALWFLLSIVLMVLLHDAYFYWTHRLMHHPKIFRYVHLVHHQSINPSPWAAYSFHPFEAVLEAGIFVLIVFCIPAHPFALLVFLVYMIVRNVFGHLGIEFLPKNFLQNRLLNWHTTTTHHDLHHKSFNHNFGLYFTWWDKWFGTEHPTYRKVFDEVTSRPRVVTGAGETLINSESGKALVVLPLLIFSQILSAQTPIGTWKTIDDGDGKARSIVLIESAGEGFLGQVIAIFPRACEQPEPVCVKCPGERKGKPVKGMNILWGFKKSGNVWTGGSILDPGNGKTYRCKIWLEDSGKTLKVRGYWGIFWRTQTWYREG